jgi:hypothetical protein
MFKVFITGSFFFFFFFFFFLETLEYILLEYIALYGDFDFFSLDYDHFFNWVKNTQLVRISFVCFIYFLFLYKMLLVYYNALRYA